ncbi:MAG: hypothetical protein HYZ57_10305 [Acidobacteria bacterium]|nr:hypothetical protein [Acidobacteriota bacterium]MBI3280220.1 hypothetical protein [Acidobacteriota bacterium]
MRALAVLLAVLPFFGLAQEHAAPTAGHEQPAAAQHSPGTQAGEAAARQEEARGVGNEIWWKWANFVILFGLLGYFISKRAGNFFQNRTAMIRQGIVEASRMKAEAEAKAAEIDKKLAGISAEIADLRRSARAEIEAEGARVRAQTEQQLLKVQANAEQEVASAAKAASAELKAHAAGLALQLAEQQLRSRLTQQNQAALLDSFLRDLDGRTGSH